MRPGSSASLRPSSSLSQHRPPSRVLARPSSRISHRPPSRNASRLAPQIASLVTLVTGIDAQLSPEDHAGLCTSVSKTLETFKHSGETVDINIIQRRIEGFTEKARINDWRSLAEAYNETYQKLLELVKADPTSHSDESSTIKESLLPDHLHFLLSLASHPSKDTLSTAADILERIRNPSENERPLTWESILADEPLEGDHWEGYLVLSDSMKPPIYRRRSLDSDLWSEDAPPSKAAASLSDGSHNDDTSLSSGGEHDEFLSDDAGSTQDLLNDLRKRQYWTEHWQPDLNADVPFNLRNPSTLGPSVQRILEAESQIKVSYMKEIDTVREVLMALQGISSCLFLVNPATAQVELSPSAPRIAHMSLLSYQSLLASFAHTSSALRQIRVIVASAQKRASGQSPSYEFGYGRSHSRTFEAFAEGVGSVINEFSQWCADYETGISFSQAGQVKETIISLLSLEKRVDGELASLHDVLIDILQRLMQSQTRHQGWSSSTKHISEYDFTQISPAYLSTYLLDALLMNSESHFARGDSTTGSALMRIFMVTMKPLWSNVGFWLKNGSSMDYTEESVGDSGMYRPAHEVTMDEEFFIKRNWLGSLVPQFWDEGFHIRTFGEGGVEVNAVPLILVDVAQEVLSAGKAVSLLRSLGMDEFFRDEDGYEWLGEWSNFDSVIGHEVEDSSGKVSPVSNKQDESSEDNGGGVFSDHARDEQLPAAHALSSQALSSKSADYLLPFCRMAQSYLCRVLVDSCKMWDHLECIEDLFLMGRGDIMSQFSDVLFARIDARQPWNDFHSLNTSLRDAILASPCSWIDPSAVRLSYNKGGLYMGRFASRTVQALEGLIMEYQVTFPLTYLFGSASTRSYSSIFVFLLQMKRAKAVIDAIIMEDPSQKNNRTHEELKLFYAMRGRLSWFVNMLMNFIMTYVLHTEVLRLHGVLESAASLDSMITIHAEHLERISRMCFLDPQTLQVHKAVISVLNLCLTFEETFSAFNGDTSIDILRRSLGLLRSTQSRRKKRRGLRKRKKVDIIGFVDDSRAYNMAEEDSSSSDDGDFELPSGDDLEQSENSISVLIQEAADSAGIPSSKRRFMNQLDDMSENLNSYIKFIRKQVDVLAGSSDLPQDAATFGILAFMMEDWDW